MPEWHNFYPIGIYKPSIMAKKRKQKEEPLKETLRTLTESNEHSNVSENVDPNIEHDERNAGTPTEKLDRNPDTKRGVTGSNDDGQAR